jgi:hypothetical protein
MTKYKKWPPFYIDTIAYHGIVTNRTDWKEVVNAHHRNIKILLALKSNQFSSGAPDFGQGAKYIASPTLGEWAEAEGMDLKI